VSNPFKVENRERIGDDQRLISIRVPMRLTDPIYLLALVRQIPKSIIIREMLEEGLKNITRDTTDMIDNLVDVLVERALDEWTNRAQYNRHANDWQSPEAIHARFEEYITELTIQLCKRGIPQELQNRVLSEIEIEYETSKIKIK